MPQPPKILIIEDEPSLLRVLADQLQDEGYEVSTASDGLQGLAIALLLRPDLIFLDVVMPQLNGIAMLQRLRQDSWGKQVPVIVLTNVSDADKIEQFLRHDVHDYIVKADWELDDVVRMAKNKLQAPVAG